MESILQLEHIEKQFAAVRALKDVSLDVRKGETMALVGENGAGKSTLMKILTGAYTRDSGNIVVAGKTIRQMDPAVSRANGIAQVYQQAEMIPELTVAENIMLGDAGFSHGGWVRWGDVYDAAERLLKRYNIPVDAHQKLGRLNVASRQLVAIAKVLQSEPRILVFDEPTAVLSDKEVAILFQIIDKLKADGTTILYISHRLEEIFELCDRIAVMRDGNMVTVLDNNNLTKDDLIVHMLGREVASMYPPKTTQAGKDAVLELEGISTDKVRDISFQLRKGEILGVAGLVGSGRTEMARAIYGMDKLKSGTIKVHGKQANIRSPEDAMKHKIFLAPEDRKGEALVLIRPIRDNITLTNLRRISKAGFCKTDTENALVEQLRQRLRIKTDSIHTLVRNLSGGNQQKVVIAKAITAQPDILIFDEPTQGIDVGAKSEIYALLEELRANGMSIIMISSEIEEVQGMCSRLLVMRGGKIVGEVEGEAVNDSEHILSMMYRSEEE